MAKTECSSRTEWKRGRAHDNISVFDRSQRAGDTAWTGAPLSRLQVEAAGERLYISGMKPLADDGARFIQNGSAYPDVLEGEGAKTAVFPLKTPRETTGNRHDRNICPLPA